MTAPTGFHGTFEESLGVKVSSEWLDACCAFLTVNQQRIPLSVDSVLSQLLVSDLRDVVRSSATASSTTNSPAAQQLQQAIHSSIRSQDSSKRILSESFQLLVQLEESVDMSLTAESRLTRAGPSLLPQQQYQQQPWQKLPSKSGCAKLLLTDGYSESIPLVGMEVKPVLPLHSVAGCKLLLKGPLTIRQGMLQLHPGNTTVVGGSVAELAEKQAKALEQAQQRQGVGVDATIRALIGTNPVEDETPENDEGEGASGDVVELAQVPIQRFPSTRGPLTEQPTTRTVPAHMAPTTAASALPYPVVPQRQPARTGETMASFSNPATAPSSTMGSEAINHSTGSGNLPPDTMPPPTATTSSTSPRQSRNPYAPRSVTTDSEALSSLASNASNPPTAATALSVPNPYTHPRPTVTGAAAAAAATTSTMAPPAALSRNARTPVPGNSSTSTTNPYANSVLASHPQGRSTLPGNSAVATRDHNESTLQRVTYSELRSLLNNLTQDQTLYESYYTSKKCFHIQLIQKGGHMHFNIGKEKVNGKKQYSFEIHATFGVPQSNELIVCKLLSALIEPLFSQSPAELRALTRSDRQVSNQLVEEGGKRVREQFFLQFQTWKATLFQTPEQWKTGGGGSRREWTNVLEPILLLEPVEHR